MGEDLDTLSRTEDIEEGGPDTIDTLESKNRELSPRYSITVITDVLLTDF